MRARAAGCSPHAVMTSTLPLLLALAGAPPCPELGPHRLEWREVTRDEPPSCAPVSDALGVHFEGGLAYLCRGRETASLQVELPLSLYSEAGVVPRGRTRVEGREVTWFEVWGQAESRPGRCPDAPDTWRAWAGRRTWLIGTDGDRVLAQVLLSWLVDEGDCAPGAKPMSGTRSATVADDRIELGRWRGPGGGQGASPEPRRGCAGPLTLRWRAGAWRRAR